MNGLDGWRKIQGFLEKIKGLPRVSVWALGAAIYLASSVEDAMRDSLCCADDTRKASSSSSDY